MIIRTRNEFKTTCINEESQKILAKKEHVFIGMSPSNSYYNEKRN